MPMSPFKTVPVGIRAWIPVLFLCAACAAAIAAGHDGRRAWQMMLLALPVLLWLCWPVAGPAWRRVRAVVAFAALAGFLIDGALRAFLQHQYQAAPDSTLVLGAIANTSPRESLEYLSSQLPAMTAALLALLAALTLTGVAIHRAARAPVALSRPTRLVLVGLLALCALAHLSKPWRRHHPLLFWPAWTQQVLDLRAAWGDQQLQRARLMRNAQAASPAVATDAPSTVVLVLGESVNRDNMSLYGGRRRRSWSR